MSPPPGIHLLQLLDLSPSAESDVWLHLGYCNLQDWLQPPGRGLGSMKPSGSLAEVTSGQPRGSAPELAAPGSSGVHLQLHGGISWR